MQAIIDTLHNRNLDGIFLTDDSNIRYVSGYTGSDSFVILLGEKKYFFTDYRYVEQARTECQDFEIILVDRDTETLEQRVAELMLAQNVKNIGFEKNHVTYKLHENLIRERGNTEFVPTEGIVETLRARKTEEEISFITKASRIADYAFEQILGFLRPGVTEKEAILELERIIRSNGADDIAFPIILLSGKNTSKPHGIPSDKKIEPGDFITMDFGAMFKGYRSDMTRTVIVGNPDAEQKKVYEIVREAQIVGSAAIKSGVLASDVNQKVVDFFSKYNYLEFASKGVGHGLGLDIHETPFINGRCKKTLETNNVITMEPGIYIPKWGGVRIEDTVIVTDQGCINLSESPKDLITL